MSSTGRRRPASSIGTAGGQKASSLGENLPAERRQDRVQNLENIKKINALLDQFSDASPARKEEIIRQLRKLGPEGISTANTLNESRIEAESTPISRGGDIYDLLTRAYERNLQDLFNSGNPEGLNEEQLAFKTAVELFGKDYGYGWADIRDAMAGRDFGLLTGSNQDYSKGFKRALEMLSNPDSEFYKDKNFDDFELSWVVKGADRFNMEELAYVHEKAEERERQQLKEIKDGTASLNTYQRFQGGQGNNYYAVQKFWLQSLMPGMDSSVYYDAINNIGDVKESIPDWLKKIMNEALSLSMRLWTNDIPKDEKAIVDILSGQADPKDNPYNIINMDVDGLTNLTQSLGHLLAGVGGSKYEKHQAKVYLARELLRQMSNVISPGEYAKEFGKTNIRTLRQMLPLLYARKISAQTAGKIVKKVTGLSRVVGGKPDEYGETVEEGVDRDLADGRPAPIENPTIL